MDTDFAPDEAALLHEKVEVSAHPHQLVQIHQALDRFETGAIAMKGEAAATGFDAFRTAAVEIATNIMRHAYPPGQAHAPLIFELWLYAQRLEGIFYDHGIAFEPPKDVAPPALDNFDLDDLDAVLEMPEGNLGLFLALQALDRLDYSRTPAGVNQWRLIKLIQ